VSVLPGPGAAPAGDPAARAVRADLLRRGEVLRVAARRVRRRQDAQAIHDLRVAARRLTAALAVWAPLLRPRARRRLRREVRALRRRIGPTREREVMHAMLAARLDALPPSGRRVAADLLERLQRRVGRGRAAAARQARAPRIARLLRRLDRAAAVVEARAALRPGALDRAAGIADARRAAARDALAAGIARGADDALHRARIAVKRWRYAEECLRAAGVERPDVDPARLRALQEALGDLHDVAVLRDRLRREADRRAARGAVADAAALVGLVPGLERERRRALETLSARANATA
jgi:CHAD domain-containing protein